MAAMSAAASVVGAASIKPSSLLAVALARITGAGGETFDAEQFPQPPPDRLGGNAGPANPWRDVPHHDAPGRKRRSFTDPPVIDDPDARRQHHKILDRHASGNPSLGHH